MDTRDEKQNINRKRENACAFVYNFNSEYSCELLLLLFEQNSKSKSKSKEKKNRNKENSTINGNRMNKETESLPNWKWCDYIIRNHRKWLHTTYVFCMGFSSWYSIQPSNLFTWTRIHSKLCGREKKEKNSRKGTWNDLNLVLKIVYGLRTICFLLYTKLMHY